MKETVREEANRRSDLLSTILYWKEDGDVVELQKDDDFLDVIQDGELH